MKKFFIYSLPVAIALALTTTISVGQGRVGINTITPAAGLHVMDSSVLFSGMYPLPASPGNLPVSGAGTRLMWYPGKAALRAGSVTAMQWNKDSIGNYSIALGIDTKAKGEGSVALGGGTIASGQLSTAMGTLTTASALYSTSFGLQTIASGIGSTAFGFQTLSSGVYATASGYLTKAKATGSFAAGGFTVASGDASASFGLNTIAKSYSSVVFGRFNDTTNMTSASAWINTDPLFVIGNGVSGAHHNALTVLKNGRVGINNISPLAMLHVQDSNVLFRAPDILSETANPPLNGPGIRMMWFAGRGAFRTGKVNSTVWDKNFTGYLSFASGEDTKASGFASVALGCLSEAKNHYTVATGFQTQANGWGSTAVGDSTIADGKWSFSMGQSTKVSAHSGVVLGKFNYHTTGNGNEWIPNDIIFEIGNGQSQSARSNAFTVLKNGKTGINVNHPSAMLHVADSSVVFTGLIPLPGTPSNPPISGTGARMMWYADKAAFRAGTVLGNNWDKDSIGSYSACFNYNNRAVGSSSAAFGSGNIAKGISSFATGTFNDAIGNYSFATGNNCIAQGTYSVAIGQSNKALGLLSFASGQNSIARGIFSVTMGSFTKANAYASVVLGRYNDTTYISSDTWVPNDPVFMIGNGTANNARGNALTVLKNGNTGIGPLVNPSHRLHVTTNDPGDGGWTEGIMVESLNASAGEAAISFRNSSIPSNKQWIVGVNQAPPGLSFNYGSSLAAGNTKMFIDTIGKMGIGTTTPYSRLHLKNQSGGGTYGSFPDLIIEDEDISSLQFSSPNEGLSAIYSGNNDIFYRSGIVFKPDSSITFRTGGQIGIDRVNFDKDGNVGIGGIYPDYRLEVNGTAGKPGGGSWANSSDLRLKQNIHPYADGLEKILKINPVTYHYNELSGYDTDPEFVGVIAQELKEIAPYMVSVSSKQTDDGVNDYLSVDNSAMTYMLINAVKEQQQIIRDQQATMDFLMKELSAVKSQLDKMNQDANTIVEK